MTIGNISGRTEISAPQNNPTGDRSSASSPSVAARAIGNTLARIDKQLPSIQNKRKALAISLSGEPLRKVCSLLKHTDVVRLSRTCTSLHDELKTPLDNIVKSRTLTRLPRNSRFATVEDILANTYPNADVLNNLVAAYGFIPRQQRLQAKQAIVAWEKLLPESQIGGICDVGVRLDKIASELKPVDAFHEGDPETAQIGIAQIMNLPPKDQVGQFLAKCDDILRLPQEHRLDAFIAILDKTKNLQVLKKLASQVLYLPKADRYAGWNVIFEETKDPQVLQQLESQIENLPEENRSAGWYAILKKIQNLQVLKKLVSHIVHLPEEDRYAALHAMSLKTQDPEVLFSLACRIGDLSQADQYAGWNVISEETKDPQVLQQLISQIKILPKENQSAGWHTILNKTQNLQVLKKLVSHIAYLPKADRYAALHAMSLKTQDLEVLQNLALQVLYLPEAHRNEATLAIDNARNLTIERLRIQSH